MIWWRFHWYSGSSGHPVLGGGSSSFTQTWVHGSGVSKFLGMMSIGLDDEHRMRTDTIVQGLKETIPAGYLAFFFFVFFRTTLVA